MVTLLLMSAGTALGASKSVNDCQSVKRDLISLEISQNTLSVQNVDHPSEDTATVGLNSEDNVEDIENLGDVSAPILYLTPRVSDLLQDMFSAPKSSDEPVGEMTSSPLADSIEESDSTGLDIESDAAADDELLPTFQQQMFRRDI